MQVQLLLRLQAQLLLRLLLATTIATRLSGITRRANRYSTQIAAVYLHVADRYSTSTSGITRRANRYSTQIAAVLACSRPLFDKHQRYNAKNEPHDRYVNRNRRDFMFFFFAMMRSQHMFAAQASPNSRACQGRKFFEQPRSHQRPHAPGKRPHAPGTHATRRNIAVAIPLAFNKACSNTCGQPHWAQSGSAA